VKRKLLRFRTIFFGLLGLFFIFAGINGVFSPANNSDATTLISIIILIFVGLFLIFIAFGPHDIMKRLKDSHKQPQKIKETKVTCEACGNVWYYGKQEVLENKAAAMQNLGKCLMCCGGCLPAVLMQNKKLNDLSRCQKCGSRATKKEEITHDIQSVNPHN